jgi:molecular chaperone GrpE
MHFANTCLI